MDSIFYSLLQTAENVQRGLDDTSTEVEALLAVMKYGVKEGLIPKQSPSIPTGDESEEALAYRAVLAADLFRNRGEEIGSALEMTKEEQFSLVRRSVLPATKVEQTASTLLDELGPNSPES